MADQDYKKAWDLFWIDFHNVGVSEARKAIKKRIEECTSYGIKRLKVIYGTPDYYQGSIAQALYQVLESGMPIEVGLIPISFWKDPELFCQSHPYIEISISRLLATSNSTVNLAFSPFLAKYETDYWKKNLCENWFYPLREWYSTAQIIARLGNHCSPEELNSLIKDCDSTSIKKDVSGKLKEVHVSLIPKIVTEWIEYRQKHPFLKSTKKPIPKRRKYKTQESSPPLPLIKDALEVDTNIAQSSPLPPDKSDLKITDFSEQEWLRTILRAIEHINLGDYAAGKNCLEVVKPFSAHLGWKYEYIVLSNLGYVCELIHELEMAGEYYLAALAVAEKNTNSDSPFVRSTKYNLQLVTGGFVDLIGAESGVTESPTEQVLGQMLRNAEEMSLLGKLVEAYKLLQEAYSLSKQQSMPALVEIIITQQLAYNTYQRGDLISTVDIASTGLRIADAKLPNWHTITVALRMILALALRYIGKYETASDLFQTLIEQKSLHSSIQSLAYTHLGTCLRQSGDKKGAEKAHRQAIQIEQGRGASKSWICGMAHSNLGVVLRETDRLKEAEKEYRLAYEIIIQTCGRISQQAAEVLVNQGMLCLIKNRFEDADRYLSESLEIRLQILGPDHFDTANSQYGLAQLRLMQNRIEDAMILIENAFNTRKRSFGETHPSTLRAKEVMEAVKLIGCDETLDLI